jgi:hypothetical protein
VDSLTLFALELFAQGNDGYETGKRIGMVVGGIMALIGVLKYLQKMQQQREMLALKKFQEGDIEEENPVVKTFPRGKLLRKLRPTKELLAFTATKDSWFDETYLKQVAKEVFTTIRDAWESRDWDLLKGYVTPDFYADYVEAVKTKKGKQRPMSFEDLRLTRMEVVQFVASSKPDNHSFTVLITAESMVEEEDEDEDSDDEETERVAYQEFWTFKRRKRWQLHKFRDIGTSDAVQEQNVMATEWFKEFRDEVNTKPDNMDFVIPS